jgi:hypothetical protein
VWFDDVCRARGSEASNSPASIASEVSAAPQQQDVTLERLDGR